MSVPLPRMERGPFLGPNGPFSEDFVYPKTEPTDAESISFLQEAATLKSTNSNIYFNSSLNATIFEYDTYPSEYTSLQIWSLAILITVFMVVIVVGNLLVIIAIATEKSLKNVTNWFIASLAVSDLLLGIAIMPFSLANQLMGYWIFGELWCELYLAVDVLMCTASINNICLVSLDRYWSITRAVAYLRLVTLLLLKLTSYLVVPSRRCVLLASTTSA